MKNFCPKVNDKKIIVLSRSKELNGINEIKRSLPKLNSKFIVIENFFNLIKLFCCSKKDIEAIFCLSNSELFFAIFITQISNVKIPIILGVYHPKQMSVTLDANYSITRSKVFKKILSNFSLNNIIFNSYTAFEESMAFFPLKGSKNIISAPSIRNQIDISLPKTIREKRSFISIITVGRYVDFKVCTILAMIETVDKLNSEGYHFVYHIYGQGVLYNVLYEKIISTKYPEKFILHEYLEPELFNATVLQHDLSFSMGFALTHSAMLGVPSIIAIQDERRPITYGFYSYFNHKELAMFGDKTKGVPEVDLEIELKTFAKLTLVERQNLGQQCQDAWFAANNNDYILSKLDTVFKAAMPTEHSKITLLDLIKIRFETYWSRFNNKARADT